MASSLVCVTGADRPGAAPCGDWRAVLAEAICDPAVLCRRLGLPAALASEAAAAAGDFPMRVPQPYLARIRPGDPQDPLLIQVLPRGGGRVEVPGFLPDPLGEAAACSTGLLRKYKRRLLIVASGVCGVHCRFCFRRHFRCPAPAHRLTRQALEPVSGLLEAAGSEGLRAGAWDRHLARIAADESIEEVILSGGDPLTLPDPCLSRLSSRLAAVAHVRRLRIHTRMPIVIPQRVTDELLTWLRATRLVPIVVVHANHPAELDSAVAAALTRLVDAGIPVLHQAVLLRGVNDDAQVLADLCCRLADLRVLPYYLHQLDRVAGAAHFEVPVARGVELIRQLRAELPGYAVPRYVRETPGAPSKEVLA